ncbi:unknown protein [Desulfotalea psychrophila LSv54]|uniref:Uncharacterized protein n=1 Tax=Desulfotalea psychrophila (strain LSv54 / DSM 12343) TaxID=177439 RepID=Q6AK22_DESPS|nr:unknown protein [Desulfotalea psychrophila LSv54]
MKVASPRRTPAQYAAGPPRASNNMVSIDLFYSQARQCYDVMASPNQITISQSGISKPVVVKLIKPIWCKLPSTTNPATSRKPSIRRSKLLTFTKNR